MPQEQLAVRSTDARELAHRLAREEGRSVSDVVLDALRRYEADAQKERAGQVDAFWADLDAIADRANRGRRPLGACERGSDTSSLYDDAGLPA